MRLIAMFILGTLLCYACTGPDSQAIPQGSGENWGSYLGGKGSSQYSSLSQITADNAARLTVAWTYNSRDADPNGRTQIQCNPLIISGVLYGSSPSLRFFALNAATGKEIWSFDPGGGAGSLGVNRGLVYWESGEDRRILCTSGSTLFALNADNGTLINTFGDSGRVDLHKGLGREVDDQIILANTPGVVYQDLLILGTRVNEGLPAAPGHIRAYDVRTGEIAWVFHTIPQPGEFGYDTWPEDAYQYIGGANSWAGMSLDEARGIVYIPTGSAAADFYGANRKGANLFANCLLALDAATGERIWHYQTIHHDIWDRDLPAPPNLVSLNIAGKRVDAVAQITKSGFVFVFDRETGEPLFPIEEIPAPASDLPGEEAWATQPVPVKPPPFARQYFTVDSASQVSPESHKAIIKRLAEVRTGERFIPPSKEGTLIFPGFDGGGEWGGAAVDPESGFMYVNANEMPWILTMFELLPEDSQEGMVAGRNSYVRYCASCHGIDRKGGSFMGEIPSLEAVKSKLSVPEIVQLVQKGQGVMPAFSWLSAERIEEIATYLFASQEALASLPETSPSANASGERQFGHTGYNRFKDPDGYPAIKPPWGTLNAIDLNKGEIAWKIPLGEFEELTQKGIPITGTENYGGPVVTAGGVIFIAASQDEKFRVFNKRDGNLLFETQLPAGGYATPSTYWVDGTQYVVIACGGGKMGTASGDAYVAFALPE